MPAADAQTGDAGLATDEQALHPALSIALQHPIITCDPDPRMVCSLLQVSKTWSRAVQQTSSCSVVISNAPREPYGLRPPGASGPVTALRDIASLSCLASWLFNHASLVAVMQLYVPDPDEAGEEEDDYADKAYPIMLRCLQQAAAAAMPAAAGQAPSALSCEVAPPAMGAATLPEAAAAGAAASAAAVSSPAVPQPQLRLKSFSSNYLHSPAILAALPAATLTWLQIEEDWDYFDPAACAAALGRLTNLRELYLPEVVDVQEPFLEALAKPAHLTKLSGLIWCSGHTAKHLPQQLVDVGPLCISMDDETESSFDLTHIKDLQSLHVVTLHPLVDPCSLPTKLTALTLVDKVHHGGHGVGVPCVTAFQVTALQQLQRLKVCYPSGCVDRAPQLQLLAQLQQLLAQLQQLQSLQLKYASFSDALSAAPAWCHLTCLNGLELVGVVDEGMQTAGVQQVLRAVAACTGLTTLILWWEHVPDDASAEVCSQLKGLKTLASLSFGCLKLIPKDLVHLRELTSLTELHFCWCSTVDDYAAVTMACALATCSARSRLESLAIYNAGLRSPAALPAIAMLTGLKQLNLSGNPGAFTDESLMHLTTLTRLTELITSDGQFTTAALEGFWAAIRG